MIVLGLDPGIARTGFGVIDTKKPGLFVRCGVLTTPKEQLLEDRLVMMGGDLQTLITETKPQIAIVEQIFFGKNVTTAFLTAQCRGVLLYVLRANHITLKSITPLQIKSRLTGHGKATKQQVQKMVAMRLHLDAVPQPDDAADALAAALCYAS